jgi:hypothetical protein
LVTIIPSGAGSSFHHGDDLQHVLAEGGEILAGELATAGGLDFSTNIFDHLADINPKPNIP